MRIVVNGFRETMWRFLNTRWRRWTAHAKSAAPRISWRQREEKVCCKVGNECRGWEVRLCWWWSGEESLKTSSQMNQRRPGHENKTCLVKVVVMIRDVQRSQLILCLKGNLTLKKYNKCNCGKSTKRTFLVLKLKEYHWKCL